MDVWPEGVGGRVVGVQGWSVPVQPPTADGQSRFRFNRRVIAHPPGKEFLAVAVVIVGQAPPNAIVGQAGPEGIRAVPEVALWWVGVGRRWCVGRCRRLGDRADEDGFCLGRRDSRCNWVACGQEKGEKYGQADKSMDRT